MEARSAVLWAALTAVSLALGYAFHAAGFPAALLLGPMIAAIAFGVRGSTLRLPPIAFHAAQAIVGCLVASTITAPILSQLGQSWLPMTFVVATTVAAGAIVGWVLTRAQVLPGSTAAWGSSAGAAAAMVAMADEFGADARLVAFMQYLRLVLVVVTASTVSRILIGGVPPHLTHSQGALPASMLDYGITLAVAAASCYAALRLRVPAGALLGPLIAGATLHAAGLAQMALPPAVVAAAYLGLGWYVGLRFSRETLRDVARALPQMLLATAALIGACALSAVMLWHFFHTDPLTAYLATSPGGLDSVAIIAIGSAANVPFILATQTLRVLTIILAGPPIARFIATRAVPKCYG